ncbi:MAG: hypothetical protein IKH57_24025 [Clostridia bacterium]|nr:hypothetical protein [Clostridia bacterium]MBR6027937.1 hypothetical protein [Clostridia bacterium]
MKKLTAGVWITCVAAVLAIAALCVYGVNIGGEGYYKDAAVNNFTLVVCGAVLCLAAAIALYQFKGGKVVEIVTGVLRVAACALIAFGLMNLIAGRVDGLGYIYFSNADVAKEVQTAANLASAQTAIWSMALLGTAMLAAVIAAFFSLRKKDA